MLPTIYDVITFWQRFFKGSTTANNVPRVNHVLWEWLWGQKLCYNLYCQCTLKNIFSAAFFCKTIASAFIWPVITVFWFFNWVFIENYNEVYIFNGKNKTAAILWDWFRVKNSFSHSRLHCLFQMRAKYNRSWARDCPRYSSGIFFFI